MSTGRIVLWGAVAWLLLAAFLATSLWPGVPKIKSQWFFFVAFVPPLYVLGEAGGSWLFSRRHGYAISRHRFSIARILIALPVALAAVALSWWLSWLLGKA
jgi:hypothetical protein